MPVPVAAQSKAQVCGLSPAENVGSNPAGAMDVCRECCVLSGRDLCDGLITRPEESYRLWCVVVCDLETSRMRRPEPALGCKRCRKTKIPAMCSFTRQNLQLTHVTLTTFKKQGVVSQHARITVKYLRILGRFEVLMQVLLKINLLKTKRNLFYIRNQFVPRSKHFPPRS